MGGREAAIGKERKTMRNVRQEQRAIRWLNDRLYQLQQTKRRIFLEQKVRDHRFLRIPTVFYDPDSFK